MQEQWRQTAWQDNPSHETLVDWMALFMQNRPQQLTNSLQTVDDRMTLLKMAEHMSKACNAYLRQSQAQRKEIDKLYASHKREIKAIVPRLEQLNEELKRSKNQLTNVRSTRLVYKCFCSNFSSGFQKRLLQHISAEHPLVHNAFKAKVFISFNQPKQTISRFASQLVPEHIPMQVPMEVAPPIAELQKTQKTQKNSLLQGKAQPLGQKIEGKQVQQLKIAYQEALGKINALDQQVKTLQGVQSQIIKENRKIKVDKKVIEEQKEMLKNQKNRNSQLQSLLQRQQQQQLLEKELKLSRMRKSSPIQEVVIQVAGEAKKQSEIKQTVNQMVIKKQAEMKQEDPFWDELQLSNSSLKLSNTFQSNKDSKIKKNSKVQEKQSQVQKKKKSIRPQKKSVVQQKPLDQIKQQSFLEQQHITLSQKIGLESFIQYETLSPRRLQKANLQQQKNLKQSQILKQNLGCQTIAQKPQSKSASSLAESMGLGGLINQTSQLQIKKQLKLSTEQRKQGKSQGGLRNLVQAKSKAASSNPKFSTDQPSMPVQNPKKQIDMTKSAESAATSQQHENQHKKKTSQSTSKVSGKIELDDLFELQENISSLRQDNLSVRHESFSGPAADILSLQELYSSLYKKYLGKSRKQVEDQTIEGLKGMLGKVNAQVERAQKQAKERKINSEQKKVKQEKDEKELKELKENKEKKEQYEQKVQKDKNEQKDVKKEVKWINQLLDLKQIKETKEVHLNKPKDIKQDKYKQHKKQSKRISSPPDLKNRPQTKKQMIKSLAQAKKQSTKPQVRKQLLKSQAQTKKELVKPAQIKRPQSQVKKQSSNATVQTKKQQTKPKVQLRKQPQKQSPLEQTKKQSLKAQVKTLLPVQDEEKIQLDLNSSGDEKLLPKSSKNKGEKEQCDLNYSQSIDMGENTQRRNSYLVKHEKREKLLTLEADSLFKKQEQEYDDDFE